MKARALVAIVALVATACVSTKTTYQIDEHGRPVVTIERSNFMRVGQGLTKVSTDGSIAILSQLASEDAMSEQLKAAWSDLNRTAQLVVIGTVLGSVVGQPVLGGVAGGVGSEIEKAVSGDEGEAVGEAAEAAAEVAE